MKAWQVLAVAHNGELVCWNCMTDDEKAVARDEKEIDNISPFFASEVAQPEVCGRCMKIIEGTT